MKYIFFGTPRFAEIVLHGLIEANMPPIALVCNPDRPIGRKQVITPPPTKVLAIESSPDIDIIQPETLDDVFVKRLKALEPDFFVVAAYSKILAQSVLDIPRLGTLGVHPSLLPKYRGASPIQSVILNGETETGVTIYKLDAGMDSGPILACGKWPVASSVDYLELEEQLANFGVKLLIEVMPKFVDGKTTPQPQDESQATFTKKFTTQDGFVAPEDLTVAEQGDTEKANSILRKINALNPEPGTWTTTTDGKRMKLLGANIKENRLVLIETQLEGEKPKRLLPRTS